MHSSESGTRNGTAERRRGALFDLDGVLVDTEELKAEAHATTVARLGRTLDPEAYARVLGRSQEAVAAAMIATSGIRVAVASYNHAFAEVYAELLDRSVGASAGALDLLTALRARGFVCGVVSSGARGVVDQIIRRTGIAALIDATVSADDIVRHKPAPDAYTAALRKLGVRAEHSIAFEDSGPGVEAAVESALVVIAVRHRLNRTHDLTRAHAQVDGLADTKAIVDLIGSLLGSAEHGSGGSAP